MPDQRYAGVGMLRDFCAEHSITYDECGKLIVALDETERGRLSAIHRRATANGVPGGRHVTAEEAKEIEPHVRGVAGLHSPSTAIVDYAEVTRRVAEDARAGRWSSAEVRTRDPTPCSPWPARATAVTCPWPTCATRWHGGASAGSRPGTGGSGLPRSTGLSASGRSSRRRVVTCEPRRYETPRHLRQPLRWQSPSPSWTSRSNAIQENRTDQHGGSSD